MVFDARYEVQVITKCGDRSSIALSFHENIQAAKAHRVELMKSYIDVQGFDQDSGDYDSEMIQLSVRPSNSFGFEGLEAWDFVHMVDIKIQPIGIMNR